MDKWYPLLQYLAEGSFQSGQALSERLGVSRAAVWKQVQRLQLDTGIHVDAVRGRGYRLKAPLELLDSTVLQGQLSSDQHAQLSNVHVLTVTESTNLLAARQLPADSGRGIAWFAEHQTAGKGRRGRQWVSSFGNNLYMTLSWKFELPMAALSGLSLAAGCVLAEVLTANGLMGHGLKWPNDVLVDDRKLAGILVEAIGEADGPATAIIGLGVNLKLLPEQTELIDQPCISVVDINEGDVSRNLLAGMLLASLIDMCALYSAQGLNPFLPRWQAYDLNRDQPIRLTMGQRTIDGICRGIGSDGAILLETSTGIDRYHAGEVSLRKKDHI